ncbi:unnamed protein product, partial [Discosporangium mesarthrocarpum]
GKHGNNTGSIHYLTDAARCGAEYFFTGGQYCAVHRESERVNLWGSLDLQRGKGDSSLGCSLPSTGVKTVQFCAVHGARSHKGPPCPSLPPSTPPDPVLG